MKIFLFEPSNPCHLMELTEKELGKILQGLTHKGYPAVPNLLVENEKLPRIQCMSLRRMLSHWGCSFGLSKKRRDELVTFLGKCTTLQLIVRK